jgi:hypothetical protein
VVSDVLDGVSWRHVVPGDAGWYQVMGMTWVMIPRLDVVCRILTTAISRIHMTLGKHCSSLAII